VESIRRGPVEEAGVAEQLRFSVDEARAAARRLTEAGAALRAELEPRLADLDLPPDAFPALTGLRRGYAEVLAGVVEAGRAAQQALADAGTRLAEVATRQAELDEAAAAIARGPR
jgi:hypothetical protein